MPTSDRISLEVCIDQVSGLAACSGLVDRIELCAGLELGGLTPSAGLMQLAKDSGVETHVLVRPRTGDFDYDDGDLNTILNDIQLVRSFGLKGVVVGATRLDALDPNTLAKICAAADGLDLTLHRAIDVVADSHTALEVAINLGMKRVLTSGGAKTALAGRDAIRALHSHADGRIEIMAGAGINSGNVQQIVQETGVKAVHASCTAFAEAEGRITELGFGKLKRTTDRDEIKRMRLSLDAL
jgi:copper homeostasis protein